MGWRRFLFKKTRDKQPLNKFSDIGCYLFYIKHFGFLHLIVIFIIQTYYPSFWGQVTPNRLGPSSALIIISKSCFPLKYIQQPFSLVLSLGNFTWCQHYPVVKNTLLSWGSFTDPLSSHFLRLWAKDFLVLPPYQSWALPKHW